MGCREAMGHLADTPRVQMMVLSGRATTTKLNVTAPSTTTVQFCRVWFGCNPQCFLVLYWDTDTYQFGPITAVGVTNINPIRLCVCKLTVTPTPFHNISPPDSKLKSQLCYPLMYLISWLVFILTDILCERNIYSAQPGGVSQPTQIKLNISWVAGSPHLAGQNLSSSHIQVGLGKYIKG